MMRIKEAFRAVVVKLAGGAHRRGGVHGLAGFTLIELVLVIAILGVLAVEAIPIFFGTTLTAARTTAMNGDVGAIQSGVSLYAANQVATGAALSYPATLDGVAVSTPCSAAAPCFGTVLTNGITAAWFTSGTAKTYCFDLAGGSATYATCKTAGQCWAYSSVTGAFTAAACP